MHTISDAVLCGLLVLYISYLRVVRKWYLIVAHEVMIRVCSPPYFRYCAP
jgi:hypothetical protein